MTEGYSTPEGNIPINAVRRFCIGTKVWDDKASKWARIKEIPNEHEGIVIHMLKGDRKVVVESEKKTWTALVEDLYLIAPRLTFKGCKVCYEHKETKDHYPYYCPEMQENCWDNELSLNI